jgi:hypothetical protein
VHEESALVHVNHEWESKLHQGHRSRFYQQPTLAVRRRARCILATSGIRIFAERMLTSVEAFNLVYHPLNCEVHDDYEHNGSAK